MKVIKYKKEDDGRIKVSDSDKEEILSLHRIGLSARKIGKRFGISHTAVLYWVNPNIQESHRIRGKVYEGYSEKNLEEHRKYMKKKMRLGYLK